ALLVGRVRRLVVGPVAVDLPAVAYISAARELDALRAARAERLQIPGEADQVEKDLVGQALIEIRELDVQPGGAVVFDADVVAAALLLAQHRPRRRRERRAASIVGDLVQARRTKSGAEAGPVLDRRPGPKILDVRGAQPDARVRPEILVVVVAGTGRDVQAVRERALVLRIDATLIALEALVTQHALVLEVETVSDRVGAARAVAAGILPARELAARAVRELTFGEVVAHDVDLAVREPVRETLRVVIRGEPVRRLLGR